MAEAPFVININTDLTKVGAKRVAQEITAALDAWRAAEHPAPQPERGEQRLLEQLKRMRADLTVQYEKLTDDPIRREGYYVAVQLLNNIINGQPTE